MEYWLVERSPVGWFVSRLVICFDIFIVPVFSLIREFWDLSDKQYIPLKKFYD